MDCNNRQLIEPAFGQLWSVPASIDPAFCAQTMLLSSELCHVALPKGSGLGALSLGFVSGLRKCVMISKSCPKIFVKRVASGRAPVTVQEAVEAPTLVGRQTYPCVPVAWPTKNAVFPSGGVIPVGVGG